MYLPTSRMPPFCETKEFVEYTVLCMHRSNKGSRLPLWALLWAANARSDDVCARWFNHVKIVNTAAPPARSQRCGDEIMHDW